MFFSLTWDAYLHCFFLGHGSGVETSHQTLTADCCSSGAKLFPFMAVASHRAELSGSLPCFVSQSVEGCVSAGGALLSLCMISSFGAKNVVVDLPGFGGWSSIQLFWICLDLWVVKCWTSVIDQTWVSAVAVGSFQPQALVGVGVVQNAYHHVLWINLLLLITILRATVPLRNGFCS